ncbi:hypothetical protein [Kitasatospora sp. NPDC050543]|uniref:hypothetical protein n=1 Tax=Kitasatospora sp. NPDC050543 TaxID=3364054 RepID=UPI0037A992C7
MTGQRNRDGSSTPLESLDELADDDLFQGRSGAHGEAEPGTSPEEETGPGPDDLYWDRSPGAARRTEPLRTTEDTSEL